MKSTANSVYISRFVKRLIECQPAFTEVSGLLELVAVDP